jgi:hypothetical protein
MMAAQAAAQTAAQAHMMQVVLRQLHFFNPRVFRRFLKKNWEEGGGGACPESKRPGSPSSWKPRSRSRILGRTGRRGWGPQEDAVW